MAFGYYYNYIAVIVIGYFLLLVSRCGLSLRWEKHETPVLKPPYGRLQHDWRVTHVPRVNWIKIVINRSAKMYLLKIRIFLEEINNYRISNVNYISLTYSTSSTC